MLFVQPKRASIRHSADETISATHCRLPEHDLTLAFQGLAHVPQPLQTQIADSLALWRTHWQAQTVKTVRILF